LNAHLGHILFNVQPANLQFYRDLMALIGWPTLYDDHGMLGAGGQTSLWFATEVKPVSNDYDGPGVNHVGIGVSSQAEVDSAVTWLEEKGVPALFDTPRHRPEFSENEDSTYYQVMFESPDRILFEVVYTGPKQS
jgi:catechol 2,3-dioxygenase-like lactoylglutathione lyase family enzyme